MIIRKTSRATAFAATALLLAAALPAAAAPASRGPGAGTVTMQPGHASPNWGRGRGYGYGYGRGWCYWHPYACYHR